MEFENSGFENLETENSKFENSEFGGYKIKSQLKDGINPKAIHSVHGIDPR